MPEYVIFRDFTCCIEFLKKRIRANPKASQINIAELPLMFPINELNPMPYWLRNESFDANDNGSTIDPRSNIDDKTLMASSHSFALKNTHAILMKLNVTNHATIVGIVNPSFFQKR